MGAHDLPNAGDWTPETRKRVYDAVVALAAAVVPVAAMCGFVVDGAIPAAITAIAGAFLLGGVGGLAGRNVTATPVVRVVSAGGFSDRPVPGGGYPDHE